MARSASTYRAARRAAAKAAGVPFATYVGVVSAYVDSATRLAARAKPIKHSGANPLHCSDGRERRRISAPDPRTGQVVEIVLRGPRNPNKYVPHLGKKQRSHRNR